MLGVAAVQTGGSPLVQAVPTVVSETPQTVITNWLVSMLGGVKFFTNCCTSATVVAPDMPEAELPDVQLKSFAQLEPRTEA